MQSETVDNTPLADLTAIRRDVLSVVSKRDGAAGIEIKTGLEKARDREEITVAQIYPALDALVERGLVDKDQSDGRTNSYSITKHGSMALRAHVNWLGGECND